jgi:hypothetical protein
MQRREGEKKMEGKVKEEEGEEFVFIIFLAYVMTLPVSQTM